MEYITHEVIYTSLQRNFSGVDINEEDVLNWCQEVETIYVADPDAMVQYLRIPLAVSGQRRVKLPSNIYKLLDVYEYNDNPDYNSLRIGYRKLAGHIILNKDPKEKRVMINYIGTPLDENCMPLINSDHQPACETYCKINLFEEKALNNRINQNLYFDWKQRFDGMIQGVKGGVRGWDRQKWAKMTIVMGDELPHIGFMPLANNDIFNSDQVIVAPIDNI